MNKPKLSDLIWEVNRPRKEIVAMRKRCQRLLKISRKDTEQYFLGVLQALSWVTYNSMAPDWPAKDPGWNV